MSPPPTKGFLPAITKLCGVGPVGSTNDNSLPLSPSLYTYIHYLLGTRHTRGVGPRSVLGSGTSQFLFGINRTLFTMGFTGSYAASTQAAVLEPKSMAQIYGPNLTRATTLNVHLVGGPWRCWALHIVGAGDRKSESTSIPLVQIQTTARRHRFNNCTNPHIVWFGAQTERFPPPICHVAIKSVSRRYCSGLSFLFTLSTGSFTSQPFEPKESFNSPLLPRLDHNPLN